MCDIKLSVKSAIGEVITSDMFKDLLSDAFTLLDDARTKELDSLRARNKQLEDTIANLQRILLG